MPMDSPTLRSGPLEQRTTRKSKHRMQPLRLDVEQGEEDKSTPMCLGMRQNNATRRSSMGGPTYPLAVKINNVEIEGAGAPMPSRPASSLGFDPFEVPQ